MLTVQEAMERLRISRASVYAAMDAGRLRYVERYGKRLLTEQSVAAYKPRAHAGKRERSAQPGASR